LANGVAAGFVGVVAVVVVGIVVVAVCVWISGDSDGDVAGSGVWSGGVVERREL